MAKASELRSGQIVGKLTTKRCPYCAMKGGEQMKIKQMIDNTAVLECTNSDCGHIAYNLASAVEVIGVEP